MTELLRYYVQSCDDGINYNINFIVVYIVCSRIVLVLANFEMC
jgi:hypothetical protein